MLLFMSNFPLYFYTVKMVFTNFYHVILIKSLSNGIFKFNGLRENLKKLRSEPQPILMSFWNKCVHRSFSLNHTSINNKSFYFETIRHID